MVAFNRKSQGEMMSYDMLQHCTVGDGLVSVTAVLQISYEKTLNEGSVATVRSVSIGSNKQFRLSLCVSCENMSSGRRCLCEFVFSLVQEV